MILIFIYNLFLPSVESKNSFSLNKSKMPQYWKKSYIICTLWSFFPFFRFELYFILNYVLLTCFNVPFSLYVLYMKKMGIGDTMSKAMIQPIAMDHAGYSYFPYVTGLCVIMPTNHNVWKYSTQTGRSSICASILWINARLRTKRHQGEIIEREKKPKKSWLVTVFSLCFVNWACLESDELKRALLHEDSFLANKS